MTGKRGVFIGPLFDEDSGDQFGGPLVIGSYGVAWVDSYDGNYPSWRQVRFAPRTSRRVVALSKEESSRAAVDSDLNLVGGWSFAVFNTWVNGKPRLWRIDGRGAVLIRQDANAGTPLDVDDSRVLLKRGDGALVLLRKDGSLLRVFARIGRGIARWPSAGGVLDGPRIVLDTAREIRVYGASSGTLLRHWRRAPGDPYALFGSYLEDADAGFALYYTCDANDNTTLHLLRLRDGMELVQPVRGKDDAGLCGGSVNARFTSAGLFYSETSPDRVAFVPMPSIRAARFLPIGSSG